MRPQPEYVLKLAARIVELKNNLASAEEEWERLFTTGVPVSASPKVRVISEDSGVSRILALMNASPEKGFEAKTIATDLDIPIATTRTSLSKLVYKGRVEKRGPGLYGAVREKEKEVLERTS
jgi:hypothetical protein